jgi:hypothetical protein
MITDAKNDQNARCLKPVVDPDIPPLTAVLCRVPGQEPRLGRVAGIRSTYMFPDGIYPVLHEDRDGAREIVWWAARALEVSAV